MCTGCFAPWIGGAEERNEWYSQGHPRPEYPPAGQAVRGEKGGVGRGSRLLGRGGGLGWALAGAGDVPTWH